jgi:hypothetical protein
VATLPDRLQGKLPNQIQKNHGYSINRPLPGGLLLRLDLFLIILWNYIVQEFEEVFEILKLSIFILVEIVELLLVLLRECSVESGESIIGGGISKWSTLMRDLLEVCPDWSLQFGLPSGGYA